MTLPVLVGGEVVDSFGVHRHRDEPLPAFVAHDAVLVAVEPAVAATPGRVSDGQFVGGG